MLRVGVIGTGAIGREHIRRLTRELPGAEVVAVADVDAARARAAAATVPGCRVHESGEALVADPAVAAVVVTSWGPTHARYVLACIAAGKPVFCEKPLATTTQDCLRILAAETAFGRRLVQVGFMRRFDPGYRAMHAEVRSGAIGRPLLFHSVHRNASVPPHWTDAMAIEDTAVHDIDLARWLFDDEIAAVTVWRPRAPEHAGRRALVVLETAGGALADIEVSVDIGYGYDIRGELVGETGTVELAPAGDVLLRREGRLAAPVPADWRERFAAAFDAELRAWIAAASEGTATGPSAFDGHAATAVAEAGLRALGAGTRQTVGLVDRPALYRDHGNDAAAETEDRP